MVKSHEIPQLIVSQQGFATLTNVDQPESYVDLALCKGQMLHGTPTR